MQYDDLAGRVRDALERGAVTPAQVERMLAEPRRATRPGVSGVLAGMGLLVAYIGVAFLYGIQWHSMGDGAKTLTPFLFPAAAIGAAIALHRASRPRWESELAGVVGFVALALAFLAAGVAFDPADDARFAAIAAAIATIVVAAVHLELRNVRLTGWGLSASVVAMTCSFAVMAGVDSAGGVASVLAAQGAAAAAVSWYAFGRSRETSASAARTALLLFYLAALAGQEGPGYGHLSVWHLLLSLAVAGAFVCSVALGFDGLVWLGALGALIWLGMVGDIIGSSTGWAFGLVLIGLGLVGLSVLVAALRRSRPAIG